MCTLTQKTEASTPTKQSKHVLLLLQCIYICTVQGELCCKLCTVVLSVSIILVLCTQVCWEISSTPPTGTIYITCWETC